MASTTHWSNVLFITALGELLQQTGSVVLSTSSVLCSHCSNAVASAKAFDSH